MFATQEIAAKSYLFASVSGRKQAVVTYPDKTLGWNMHQKPADKFIAGKCKFLPLTMVLVIFSCKCNRAVSHAFNTVVAYGYTVSVLAKIFDHGFGTLKRFFAIRNPFFSIAGIQKLLENIMIFKRLRCAMEFQFSIRPKLLSFCEILATEYFRDNLDRKKKIFSVIFPMILRIKSSAKYYGVYMRMEIHLAPPGMKDTYIAYVGSEMFFI